MIKETGYIPGEGMISPARDIFYLNIPKNASTYLSNILLANNWEHWNIITDITTVQHSIAFIRDPLDRWISGFSTYVALHILGNGYGSDHFIKDYNLNVPSWEILLDNFNNSVIKKIELISDRAWPGIINILGIRNVDIKKMKKINNKNDRIVKFKKINGKISGYEEFAGKNWVKKILGN